MSDTTYSNIASFRFANANAKKTNCGTNFSIKNFVIASIIAHVLLVVFFQKLNVAQCPIAGKVIEVSILNLAPPAPKSEIQKSIIQSSSRILPKTSLSQVSKPVNQKNIQPTKNNIEQKVVSSPKPAPQTAPKSIYKAPTEKIVAENPTPFNYDAQKESLPQPQISQASLIPQNLNEQNSSSSSAQIQPIQNSQLQTNNISNNSYFAGKGTNSASNQSSTSAVNIIQNPIITRQTQPNYPAMALRRNQQGVVIVEATLSSFGSTQNIKIYKSSGYSLLDQSAVEAVKDWQFEVSSYSPSQQNIVRVPVKFLIN